MPAKPSRGSAPREHPAPACILPKHATFSQPAATWTRVELHPLYIRKLTGTEYAVFRADGRGAIHTRSLGADAVRLLKQVGSVCAARTVLEQAHGTRLDLTPLLESLNRAGLVYRVDGVRVNNDALALLDRARCFWRCQVDWSARAPKWLGCALPPAFALPLMRLASRRRIARSAHARSASKIASALPHPTSARAAEGFRVRYLEELAHTDSIARMVCTVTPDSLARWLEHRVEVEGLHHVEHARATGRGVLIVGLHAGAYPITIPTLLWKGVPFHSFNFGMRLVERKPGEVFVEHTRMLGWAASQFYYEATQRNLGRYVRAIRAGGVGLVLPDFFAPDTVPASGRRTEVDVPFGERRVLVHDFAGWLARTTGALVIPCEAIRDRRGRFRVRFSAPVDPVSAHDRDGDVTRRIFGLLAPAIERNPECWNFLGSYTHAPAAADQESRA